MTGLRAGVIGLGAMGRNHVRVLGDLPGIDFVGAVDPSSAARLAGGGTAVGADIDDLLARGIDICVVATPTLSHAEIGLQLADAGVHTLMEKPLAADARSSLLLAQAFESAGLVGCVGHIERHNSALRAMWLRVSQGELGELFQVATRRQGPFPDRIRDVGVVMDLATHDIDLTQWIAGSAYARVSAFTASPTRRAHEDMVAVSGMLADGTVTSHLVNWLSSMKERVVTVTGERGCLFADALAGELWLHHNSAAGSAGPGGPLRSFAEGDATRYAVPRCEALRTELEAFRDAALGQTADIVTMRQGVEVVRVAEAILAAAQADTAAELAAGSPGTDVWPMVQMAGAWQAHA